MLSHSDFSRLCLYTLIVQISKVLFKIFHEINLKKSSPLCNDLEVKKIEI